MLGIRTYSANGSHGMVDATWSETALYNLKATAFPENKVAGGHADIVKGDVAVTVGGIIVAVNVQHAVNGDTLCVRWHEDHGLLAVDVLVIWV